MREPFPSADTSGGAPRIRASERQSGRGGAHGARQPSRARERARGARDGACAVAGHGARLPPVFAPKLELGVLFRRRAPVFDSKLRLAPFSSVSRLFSTPSSSLGAFSRAAHLHRRLVAGCARCGGPARGGGARLGPPGARSGASTAGRFATGSVEGNPRPSGPVDYVAKCHDFVTFCYSLHWIEAVAAVALGCDRQRRPGAQPAAPSATPPDAAAGPGRARAAARRRRGTRSRRRAARR